VVALGIVGRGEADAIHRAHDEHIADDGHHRRRCGWRQPQGADLTRRTGGQTEGGPSGQLALRVRSDEDKRDVGYESAGQVDQLDELERLAGVGDEQQQVVPSDDAEVAMLRLAGVQEESRSAGRAEGGGHVHGYLSGLTHAGRDEGPPLLVYMFYD